MPKPNRGQTLLSKRKTKEHQIKSLKDVALDLVLQVSVYHMILGKLPNFSETQISSCLKQK